MARSSSERADGRGQMHSRVEGTERPFACRLQQGGKQNLISILRSILHYYRHLYVKTLMVRSRFWIAGSFSAPYRTHLPPASLPRPARCPHATPDQNRTSPVWP